jgi:four helix bundle suffix protein
MSGNRPSAPDRSVGSDRSDGSGRRLRPSGGYRKLRSFQTATIIYDATVSFCERFLDRRSRTIDQMVQAARSGRQNIAEGSRASTASSQTEIRLVSVARASLDELLLDYEDFLRQRGRRSWGKDDSAAKAVRECGRQRHSVDSDQPFGPYVSWILSEDPAVVANAVICLIHQANYLLDHQLTALERVFIRGGGYSERLASARIDARMAKQRNEASGSADETQSQTPSCTLCGRPLALRTAQKGRNAGSQFWGCSSFPRCRGTLPLDGKGPP